MQCINLKKKKRYIFTWLLNPEKSSGNKFSFLLELKNKHSIREGTRLEKKKHNSEVVKIVNDYMNVYII